MPTRRFFVIGVELLILLAVLVALQYRPDSAPAASPGLGLGVSAEDVKAVFERDQNGGFIFLDEPGPDGQPRSLGTSTAGRLDLVGDPADLARIRMSVHGDEGRLVELLADQVVPELAADVESTLEEAPADGTPEIIQGSDAVVTITLNPLPNDDIEVLIEP